VARFYTFLITVLLCLSGMQMVVDRPAGTGGSVRFAPRTVVGENKFRLPEPQAEPDHFRPRNAIRTKGKVYSTDFEIPPAICIVVNSSSEFFSFSYPELQSPVRVAAKEVLTLRGPPVSC
jgi:hypothetical protein